MELINRFNDFIENDFINLLLEKIAKQDMFFIISKRLNTILIQIHHPISQKLMDTSFYEEEKPSTLVDYDENKLGYFIITQSPKLFDQIAKTHYKDNLKELKDDVNLQNDLKNYFKRTRMEDVYWTQNRVHIKIGRLINTIFPGEFKTSGEPGFDIESFTNAFKSKLSNRFKNIKIVDGPWIKKYYLEENYSAEKTGLTSSPPLHLSCMKYIKCEQYLEFYNKNDVKLLILMSDIEGEEDKIIARALLWPIEKVTTLGNDTPIFDKDMTFMDRIYYINEYDVDTFKDYANTQGWLHKKNQSIGHNVAIYNPKNKKYESLQLVTTDTFEKTPKFPYMDTMIWFNVDQKYLSNREDYSDNTVYSLQSTTGGFTPFNMSPPEPTLDEEGMYYSHYYNQYIDPEDDDYIWCALGDDYRLIDDTIRLDDYGGWDAEYATEEYAQENYTYSEIEERYIANEDVVILTNYDDDVVSTRYANDDMNWSTKDELYYKDEDCEQSDHYDTYISNYNAVSVIADDSYDPEEAIDIDYWNTDARISGDGTYDTAIIDGEHHFMDMDILDDFFVKVIYNIDTEKGIENYKYILDNEKGYFRWKGKTYHNKYKDEFTGQLKLWEKRIRRFNEND